MSEGRSDPGTRGMVRTPVGISRPRACMRADLAWAKQGRTSLAGWHDPDRSVQPAGRTQKQLSSSFFSSSFRASMSGRCSCPSLQAAAFQLLRLPPALPAAAPTLGCCF